MRATSRIYVCTLQAVKNSVVFLRHFSENALVVCMSENNRLASFSLVLFPFSEFTSNTCLTLVGISFLSSIDKNKSKTKDKHEFKSYLLHKINYTFRRAMEYKN